MSTISQIHQACVLSCFAQARSLGNFNRRLTLGGALTCYNLPRSWDHTHPIHGATTDFLTVLFSSNHRLKLCFTTLLTDSSSIWKKVVVRIICNTFFRNWGPLTITQVLYSFHGRWSYTKHIWWPESKALLKSGFWKHTSSRIYITYVSCRDVVVQRHTAVLNELPTKVTLIDCFHLAVIPDFANPSTMVLYLRIL